VAVGAGRPARAAIGCRVRNGRRSDGEKPPAACPSSALAGRKKLRIAGSGEKEGRAADAGSPQESDLCLTDTLVYLSMWVPVHRVLVP